VFSTFMTYWYHRFQHRFSVAWRVLHQVHHGVPRLDLLSAFVTHPFELIVSETLSISVTAFLLGLDPRAVPIVGALQIFHHVVSTLECADTELGWLFHSTARGTHSASSTRRTCWQLFRLAVVGQSFRHLSCADRGTGARRF